MPSLIQFRNTCVRYSDLVTGLADFSLSVERGEFIYLLGPTGSGKSTILKLLYREVAPTSGEVWLDGENIGQLAERDIPFLRRKMGIVPQDFALLPNKTVWENVGYAMRAIGKGRREVRQTIPRILDQVRIGHRADALPHQLSGGEQQRVAIAPSLINDPPLILADEPTGNLDPEHSLEILQILEELNSKGTTVLMATHDMMVVNRCPHRILRMQGGRMQKEGALVV